MSASEFSAQLVSVETSLVNRLKPLEMWRPESRDRLQAVEEAHQATQSAVNSLGAKIDGFADMVQRVNAVPTRMNELSDVLKVMQITVHDLGERVHSLSVEVAAMRKA